MNLQQNHTPLDVPPQSVPTLASLSNLQHFNEVLDRILVPRVVGSAGHENVKNYLLDSMTNLGWHVETDDFTDKTPIFGDLKFSNVIATLNPAAERFVILACHYDSKYFPNQEFLGATDSAVPCAMMINLAHVMKPYLDSVRSKIDVSLKFVFFDGEEAFQTWSATDSIYGARHLAQKWENEGFLNRIDMLVLLDLLGAPDPVFYSFFKETEPWYIQLLKAEEKLDSAHSLERYTHSGSLNKVSQRYFQPNSIGSFIEDDHVPFMRRNVPILHLIPTPFPEVWHKITDDRKAIDLTTVENLNKIFRVFIAEYLHINL